MELVLCGPVAILPIPLWLLGMGSSAVLGARSAGQGFCNPQPMLDKQKVQDKPTSSDWKRHLGPCRGREVDI